MKVVEGSFGTEDKTPILEGITEVLKEQGLDQEKDVDFVLVLDLPDRMTTITNQQRPHDVVGILESCKFAVIAGAMVQ